MSVESNLPSSMAMIKQRLDQPSVQESMKSFTKTIEFSLTDLKQDYLFTFNDGKLSSVEKKTEPNANIIITTTNSLMEAIMNKTENAISAYMSGKISVKSSMEDLVRLQSMIG